MVRPPSKILTFKRLTRVDRAPASHLDQRIRQKINWIGRQIRTRSSAQSERANLYVALATCLEADIKYRTRFALEITNNDIDLFRRLYGEAKLDLDLLFHVVDESISLADLLAEVTNVSDFRGLTNKCETLLNVLSGSKINLLEHFKRAAAKKDNSIKAAYDIFLPNYDLVVSHIESIFQIRHAVVHDVFNGGGPVGWAVRREQLRQVYTSCIGFLMMFDDAFFRAIENGPYLKRPRRAQYEKTKIKTGKEIRAIASRLVSHHPASRRHVNKLHNSLGNLILLIGNVFSSIEGKRKLAGDDQIWSPDLANAFFKFCAKVFSHLELSSFENRNKEKGRGTRRK